MELIISLTIFIFIIHLISKKQQVSTKQKSVLRSKRIILKSYIIFCILIIIYYLFCYIPRFFNIKFDFYIIPWFNSIIQILTIILFIIIPLIYISIDFWNQNIPMILKIVSIAGISIFHILLCSILLLLLWSFNPTTIFFYKSCEYIENQVTITEFPFEKNYYVNYYRNISPFSMKYIKSDVLEYEINN